MDKSVFQRALSQYAKNHPAGSGPSAFVPWGLIFQQWMGKDAKGKDGKDAKKPVTQTPLPPITTPNPLDQPPPGQGGMQAQGVNPWLYNPATAPWMANPSGVGMQNYFNFPPFAHGQGMPQGNNYQSWQPPGVPTTGGPLPPFNPNGRY
jgi:hypothetical protein